jgi:hypothetical protein
VIVGNRRTSQTSRSGTSGHCVGFVVCEQRNFTAVVGFKSR